MPFPLAAFAAVAEAVQLKGSPSMDALAQVMQKLPIVAVTDDTGFFDDATQFLDQLKDKPAPASPFKTETVDPQPTIGFFSCTTTLLYFRF